MTYLPAAPSAVLAASVLLLQLFHPSFSPSSRPASGLPHTFQLRPGKPLDSSQSEMRARAGGELTVGLAGSNPPVQHLTAHASNGTTHDGRRSARAAATVRKRRGAAPRTGRVHALGRDCCAARGRLRDARSDHERSVQSNDRGSRSARSRPRRVINGEEIQRGLLAAAAARHAHGSTGIKQLAASKVYMLHPFSSCPWK